MSVVYFIVALLLWTGCAERIVSPPEDVIAFVGDDVELKCLVEFSGTNTLTWEFNDVAVYYYQFGKEEYPNVGDMMHGFLVKQDGSNFNVALTDVSYATAGKYTCRLTAAVAAVHVIVLDRPQLHSSVPKPEEGNIAVYTCELHFGGPKKSDVSPDLYPQLRILFDNKLVDGTSHMQEPTSNSTKYHVLKLIYHTVLASSMDGKKLTCEVVTTIPKVLANTYNEIDVQSASEDIPPDEVKADDANGGTMTTVVFFVVVNFLLLLGIILAVIGYKYAKNKHPDVLKKFSYKHVSNKSEEAPSEPPATSTKDDDTEKQKLKHQPHTKSPAKPNQEESKVSISHSNERVTMKKADEADNSKTTLMQIEGASRKTTASVEESGPLKEKDPHEGHPKQHQETSAAAQKDIGTNEPQSRWKKPEAQEDQNWQGAQHQHTSEHSPLIKELPHSPQMKTVQQTQGQGSGIQQLSEPLMSQATGANKDTTTRKSALQSGESAHKKSDAQQKSESPLQKAAREAKEKADDLRAAADKAKEEASVAEKNHKDAEKRVKKASKDEKKAAKEDEDKMKVTKLQLKEDAAEAEKKAKAAEKEAEREAKAAEKEAKAEKEAEKKAEEARKKAEKKTGKKTKGNIKNTKL